MDCPEEEGNMNIICHNNQNYNSQNLVTPVELQRMKGSLKRGREFDEDGCASTGDMRESQRLKLFNFSEAGEFPSRPFQFQHEHEQNGFFDMGHHYQDDNAMEV